MKKTLIFIFLLWPLTGQSDPFSVETLPAPPDHQLWDKLLKKHVDENGMVNYEGFLKDRGQLELYLNLLSKNAPDAESWSRHEQLAYWINAYNAFTIRLIVDHYPLKSIAELHPNPGHPGGTIWHQKLFRVGGTNKSLDEIEHQILRKQFHEPRIHFAVVCASVSCPPLRREAYREGMLEEQLHDQAVRFINDPQRNKISSNKIEISQIFSWFQEDFTKNGSLTDFLNHYANSTINPKASVKYLNYNWGLNKQ